MGAENCIQFISVTSSNLGIDVSTYDYVSVSRDFMEKGIESFDELFMWDIMTWMIDRREEDGE
jgi:hypothetical protein